jgi:hypothetical protein
MDFGANRAFAISKAEAWVIDRVGSRSIQICRIRSRSGATDARGDVHRVLSLPADGPSHDAPTSSPRVSIWLGPRLAAARTARASFVLGASYQIAGGIDFINSTVL